MAQTVELIKKNMASFGALVTFVTLIVGAAFAVESRYAKAADITDLKSYVKQQHDYDQWSFSQNMLQQRQQQLEDQLFILRLKKNPNSVDLALIERYSEQLREIIAKLGTPPPPSPDK